ncbi:Piwi domain-containing protein [Schizophyllum amplum]|uniref:Piwi domain-containing protein n=1 Tax=Schizophyllum amplum TaxID=97359 RepID=A0A550C6Q9_9AGAR|nr:Piwi domain-containing protein [Auriculariopsis ampla]
MQISSQATTIADPSVQTIGVRRPGFGTAGTRIPMTVNAFKMDIEGGMIYHYDDIVGEKVLPIKRNMELFKILQYEIAPNVFVEKISYDGRKNAISHYRLNIKDDYQEFPIQVGGNPSRPPRIIRIKMKLVAQINSELLTRFVQGKQSHDNTAITAIQALNIVLRMEPTQKYTFNTRSFYVPEGRRQIQGGLELWRAYFQSVRPAMNQLVVNVDVSAGVMYQAGPLINLCLSFLRRPPNNPNVLGQMNDRDRLELKRFLVGLKVVVGNKDNAQNAQQRPPRSVTGLSRQSAKDLTFNMRREGQTTGQNITVAQYFRTVVNRPLQYPNLPCVEVGSGKAMLPLEICVVPPGQLMRKQVPADATREMVQFSAQRPSDRFAGIQSALQTLAYSQSTYVQHFGMSVGSSPLQVTSRTLPAPKMQYGRGSRQPTVQVKFGAWNMADKHFYVPMPLDSWAVMVMDSTQRFSQQLVDQSVRGLKEAASACGMTPVADPVLTCHRNPQGNIMRMLTDLMNEAKTTKGVQLKIVVVILPNNGDEIWATTKFWGDISMGVATQCLKAQKCAGANIQYWANVCLKLNGKLGGINTVPDPQSANILSDPHHPTLVLGADVIHPSPGSVGRPSFTAMVGNVDRSAAKYIATSRAQTSRQEIIDDFGDMAKEIIRAHVDYREHKEGARADARFPSRILVYRDGVSEGQFKQVKELELPKLIEACKELGIKPKITFIIVGKRHHIRMKPGPRDEDRTGNAPAGSIIDTDITHPVEFDFYLQSHAGIKGTSRPAHYSVLYDENTFTADGLQQLTYTLCHVYARSTRSVSIPAPTYYADIVCARAKTHYAPGTDLSAASETASSAGGHATEQGLQQSFQQVHPVQKRRMYFQ